MREWSGIDCLRIYKTKVIGKLKRRKLRKTWKEEIRKAAEQRGVNLRYDPEDVRVTLYLIIYEFLALITFF